MFDCLFIDLCAGSGAMGIEAASRGANEVYFVEKSKKAYQVLKQNCKKFSEKFSDAGQLTTFMGDFSAWLKKSIYVCEPYQSDQIFIFFDPPYEEVDLYKKAFDVLKESNIKAILVIEACEQKTMRLKQFEEVYGQAKKTFKQGTSFFAVYDL